MKKEFYSKLQNVIGRKKSNSMYYIDTLRYQDFIDNIKEIKNRQNKNFEDYKLLASYDILVVIGRERLIQRKTEDSCCTKFYVHMDDLFGVLHTIHLLFKHADKDVMDAQIKTKYCNVSKEAIKIYLTCCKTCKERE